jgi:hypothetical protein
MPGSGRVRRSLFAVFSVAALALTALAGRSHAVAGPAVTSVDMSPQRISAGDGETTVSFTVARPGTVVFTLTRLEPDSGRVGRFGVAARSGPNDFLFPGRIDRRLLRPGTYRLSASGPGGRAVGAVLIVTRDAPRAGDAQAADGRDGLPVRPFLVAALLVAIVLLGVASLPASAARSPRAAEALAARRPAAAVAGGLTLAVAFALYLLSVV